MKKLIMYIIIAVLLVILPIVVGYLAIITGAIFMFMPEPPKPEITYGEFPIRITYEIDGEIKVLEDTIICEYDGVKNYGSGGKRRQWKVYIKSSRKKMITLCDMRTKLKFTDWGNQILELCFDVGSGGYYMGDPQNTGNNGSSGKWIDYIYVDVNGEEGYSVFTINEAWEKYKLRIIDVQYSQPIKNSFE